MEKYYKSQELYREYRSQTYRHCVCLNQFITKSGMIEKWIVIPNESETEIILLVEIYADGNGFQEYTPLN